MSSVSSPHSDPMSPIHWDLTKVHSQELPEEQRPEQPCEPHIRLAAAVAKFGKMTDLELPPPPISAGYTYVGAIVKPEEQAHFHSSSSSSSHMIRKMRTAEDNTVYTYPAYSEMVRGTRPGQAPSKRVPLPRHAPGRESTSQVITPAPSSAVVTHVAAATLPPPSTGFIAPPSLRSYPQPHPIALSDRGASSSSFASYPSETAARIERASRKRHTLREKPQVREAEIPLITGTLPSDYGVPALTTVSRAPSKKAIVFLTMEDIEKWQEHISETDTLREENARLKERMALLEDTNRHWAHTCYLLWSRIRVLSQETPSESSRAVAHTSVELAKKEEEERSLPLPSHVSQMPPIPPSTEKPIVDQTQASGDPDRTPLRTGRPRASLPSLDQETVSSNVSSAPRPVSRRLKPKTSRPEAPKLVRESDLGPTVTSVHRHISLIKP